jgi:predicted ribosome quality control (RQC) complex YloA/Tae2 family protein
VRPAPRQGELPSKLTPWRFRTLEGWDVLIGRTSEGNDHLTVHVARPEDYWFHAHGCPGSHVVLRRGKGPNEPSKATLEEVAGWAAFHSKARTAGKVPVNYTQKKYVRKPRGAKPGLVYIEREKTLLVRPVEPPRERMADAADAADAAAEAPRDDDA